VFVGGSSEFPPTTTTTIDCHICQCWMHRWCAGVMRERYVALSSTEDPFLCPSCVVAGQQVAITAQQAGIACLREIQCVNALTDEVRSLKATVAAMRSHAASAQLCQLFTHWSGQEVECCGEQGEGEGEREWEKGQEKG